MRRPHLALSLLLIVVAATLCQAPALGAQQPTAPAAEPQRAESPEAEADAAAGAGDRHSDPWGPTAALAIGIAVVIVLYTSYRRAMAPTRGAPHSR